MSVTPHVWSSLSLGPTHKPLWLVACGTVHVLLSAAYKAVLHLARKMLART